jgi:hypothetical protein
MTRFPLKAVETSGHYFLRADTNKPWRMCYVNLEDEVVTLVGSVGEATMMHATSYPTAELFGPILPPPVDIQLDDGPLPF